jgi:hypothetical protein
MKDICFTYTFDNSDCGFQTLCLGAKDQFSQPYQTVNIIALYALLFSYKLLKGQVRNCEPLIKMRFFDQYFIPNPMKFFAWSWNELWKRQRDRCELSSLYVNVMALSHWQNIHTFHMSWHLHILGAFRARPWGRRHYWLTPDTGSVPNIDFCLLVLMQWRRQGKRVFFLFFLVWAPSRTRVLSFWVISFPINFL